MPVSAVAHRGHQIPLELEIRAAVGHPVLGTKLWSSGRTVHAFNHRVILLASGYCFTDEETEVTEPQRSFQVVLDDYNNHSSESHGKPRSFLLKITYICIDTQFFF